MAEIGLGEAIAGGTNLSGEFGSPFTRALATKEPKLSGLVLSFCVRNHLSGVYEVI